MMMDYFTGTIFFVILYGVAAVFFLLWPVLVWLHLREHTRCLRDIRELLLKKQI